MIRAESDGELVQVEFDGEGIRCLIEYIKITRAVYSEILGDTDPEVKRRSLMNMVAMICDEEENGYENRRN